MLRSGEWTLCPWTICHKRPGGSIPLIRGLGGISVEPIGFIMMSVKVPCVQGYDKDQIAIVMDDPGMTEWPVILGTPTLYRVMEVIKESEISKLAVPWASSRVSWLMRDVLAKLSQVVMNDIANKPIAPLHVDDVVSDQSMYRSSLWPQGHPWEGQSRSTWLQDECDDPWVGEVVNFSPAGD